VTEADTASLDTDYFAVSCGSASEKCASPASWEEERVTPQSYNIRNAPIARGYILGDYIGLDNASDDATALFGQTFAPNEANQYFSRLVPQPRCSETGDFPSRRVSQRRSRWSCCDVIHQSKDGLVVQLRDCRKLAPPSMP
jgi:hypothetical protein